MKNEISILLEQDESPILEFKREWYWNDDTPSGDMGDKWGELIKDIISLSNAYMRYAGKYRYLIFGFSEENKELYNVDTASVKQLCNLTSFKKLLLSKLESYTSPALTEISIEEVDIDNKKLLVFEISPSIKLIELKKQLKTKTRHLDEGSILVRKGQKSDEIRVANFSEIQAINSELDIYFKSSMYSKYNVEEKNEYHERTIEKTIQLFIDKNSSFSLAENYPKKVKNWKDGIIYEVYRLDDSFFGFKEFVYIHGSSNQRKTYNEISQKGIVENLEESIVLTDRPKKIDVEKRKSNIRKHFKTRHIFFIDEFGYEHLYKDCMLPYEKFNLPVYVDGLYDDDESIDNSAIVKLKEWLYAENEPLFIVSGHGGIGKTTLAKQFLDFVYEENHDSGILFIDSKEIISELSRNFTVDNKISDVFDFYKALMDVGEIEGTRFDRELLQLSVDNGSLIVVLDGIDEVIAKLGERFNVEGFINSIFNEYNSGLHKTKVLITCRDHFWNEVGKKILLPEITLKAFNNGLANEFFEQKLKGDRRKHTKAMSMAEELAIESTSPEINSLSTKTYIPFLLDMIGYLVNAQGTNDRDGGLVKSKYLIKSNHVDQLVAQVCHREIIKLDSLNVDQQIELFVKMASKKQNGIKFYDIKEELRYIKQDINDSLIEKIKGHPLIQCHSDCLYFRYDVFDTYFKALRLFYFFKEKRVDLFDIELARIIGGYLKYDSSFVLGVAEKLSLDDDLIIFCIGVIERSKEISEIYHHLVVSAIVSLLLTILQKDNSSNSNLESRTELLEKLFCEKGELVGICMVDVFGSVNSKPTFDFRGKVFRQCFFNNYEYFWECNIDENTRFYDSYFKGLDPKKGINFTVPEELFSTNCDTSSIQHLISIKQKEHEDSKDTVKSELEKVFKLFYQRGNFYPKKQEEVRKKLSAVKLLQELLSKGVINNYIDPKKPKMKQYKISDDYKSVIDYIEQGSPSHEFQILVNELA